MSVINPGDGSPMSGQSGGWHIYLDRGEKLLWEGAPLPGLRFKPSDLFLSIFGAFFFGFAVFWIGMASSMGGGMSGFEMIFPLFGLPFVAVGAYLMIGRYFWEAHVRTKTRYALTNKRAIVAKSAWGRSLKSWPINSSTQIEYQPGSAATLYFAKEEKRGSKGSRYTVKKGFQYIPDGDAVYRLMRQVQQGEVS
jgi:hypothetical protein